MPLPLFEHNLDSPSEFTPDSLLESVRTARIFGPQPRRPLGSRVRAGMFRFVSGWSANRKRSCASNFRIACDSGAEREADLAQFLEKTTTHVQVDYSPSSRWSFRSDFAHLTAR